ncbi:hypothetical protein PQX77_018958 [Marasmius sp. AFHP31]|nr:hypothetical protein PQX77_018958 [Marasmius sp. AFHP31]
MDPSHDRSRCRSAIEHYFRSNGRNGDHRQLVDAITVYWRTKRKDPSAMVSHCATLLKDAPELFQSLNVLLLARDGDTEVFSSCNQAGNSIEIAMVISRGKGYLCRISRDTHVDEPVFMDSDELLTFMTSNTVFYVTKYMKTVSRRWAPFVMELLQLLINRSSMCCPLRKECIIYMRYLSWSHCALPFTFYLPGVTRVGDHPVSAGGFSVSVPPSSFKAKSGYHSTAQNIWKGRMGTTKVCIKVLRFFTQTSNRDDIMKDLTSEVLLLRQLRHPNILPFFGVNEQVVSPSFAIITPWMTHGSLLVYLQRVPCTLQKKIRLIRQVVEGLGYLHTHSPPVVHCDIKAGNILVSENEDCCIGDFGLSILEKTHNEFRPVPFSDGLDDKSGIRGSLRWLAPELLNPCPTVRSSSSRDIYAVGCTIMEVISGRPPFYDEKSEVKIMIDVLKGLRPALPPSVGLPVVIWRLINSCWQEDAGARPTAGKISETLDKWLSLPPWAKFRTGEWYGSRTKAQTTYLRADNPNTTYWEGNSDTRQSSDTSDDYDLPELEDDGRGRTNYDTPAFQDSLFDARQLRLSSTTNDAAARGQANRTSSQLSTSEIDCISDSEIDTSSKGWWSDEDTDSGPATPISALSSSDSLPMVAIAQWAIDDLDTFRFREKESLSDELVKSRSEPVFPYKPPKGSLWNNRELQGAWSSYMHRQRSGASPILRL